jgi:hypothetical protein
MPQKPALLKPKNYNNQTNCQPPARPFPVSKKHPENFRFLSFPIATSFNNY